MYTTITQRN